MMRVKLVRETRVLTRAEGDNTSTLPGKSCDDVRCPRCSPDPLYSPSSIFRDRCYELGYARPSGTFSPRCTFDLISIILRTQTHSSASLPPCLPSPTLRNDSPSAKNRNKTENFKERDSAFFCSPKKLFGGLVCSQWHFPSSVARHVMIDHSTNLASHPT